MDIYDTEGYLIDPRFPKNKIHHTAIVGNNVKLGKNNIIMPYAVIGQSGFIRKGENPKGVIVIGNENVIGCYVNIMAGLKGRTFIGDDNLIMNHSNIGHDVMIHSNCEIGAGTIVNGYARIKSEVKIKSGCVIRNRIEIGKDIIVGQASNVTKDLTIPGTYYGNPVKLIKRKNKIEV